MTPFHPPSPAEISAYAASIGFKLDAEYFCLYYAQRDWMIPFGKRERKMSNWKLAVQLWKRQADKKSQAAARPVRDGSISAEEWERRRGAVIQPDLSHRIVIRNDLNIRSGSADLRHIGEFLK